MSKLLMMERAAKVLLMDSATYGIEVASSWVANEELNPISLWVLRYFELKI